MIKDHMGISLVGSSPTSPTMSCKDSSYLITGNDVVGGSSPSGYQQIPVAQLVEHENTIRNLYMAL